MRLAVCGPVRCGLAPGCVAGDPAPGVGVPVLLHFRLTTPRPAPRPAA